MTAHIRVGISGWSYAGWKGVFYPDDLPQSRQLEYASRQVQSIEVNGTFYSMQTPRSFQHWREASPARFVFSIKGPRYLTHTLRFRGPRAQIALANFFASGVLCLGPRLGPLLWQFPPSYKFDPQAFEAVLAMLPRDTEAAAALARRHDGNVRQASLAAGRKRRLRHAIEVRHASFCDAAFVKLLRKYRAALVISDSTADWPYAEDMTCDFAYLRLHGAEALYSGAYSGAALRRWADRITCWASGREPEDAVRIVPAPARRRARRDVFCYFDNDQKVQAPRDAIKLMKMLSG